MENGLPVPDVVLVTVSPWAWPDESPPAISYPPSPASMDEDEPIVGVLVVVFRVVFRERSGPTVVVNAGGDCLNGCGDGCCWWW